MKNKVKMFLISLVVTLTTSVYSQKVSMSNFSLLLNEKQVLMYWVIDSGATCSGMTIFRSTDSLNFEEIGSIGGICGSNSFATPYDFTDKTPAISKTNYYKIRLGYSQFSEVRAIHLKYIEHGKLIVKPNPTSGLVTIQFNNDNQNTYEFNVFDNNGKNAYSLSNIRGGEIKFDTSELRTGTYFIVLTGADGMTYREKFNIER